VIEVPAADVVDVAVAVVVQIVSGNLTGVHPHIRSQIRMRQVDAFIHDGNDHAIGPRGPVPSLGGIDVRVGRAARLAPIVHGPLQSVGRIIGCARCVNDKVGFAEDHLRHAPEQRECPLHINIFRKPNAQNVFIAQDLRNGHVQAVQQCDNLISADSR
jgi:hypothetical protein